MFDNDIAVDEAIRAKTIPQQQSKLFGSTKVSSKFGV
jgi:hypothetical protein